MPKALADFERFMNDPSRAEMDPYAVDQYFIYRTYYAKYAEPVEVTPATLGAYARDMTQLRARYPVYGSEESRNADMFIRDTGTWLEAHVNGGARSDSERGRFFLNTSVMGAPRVFDKAVALARGAGLEVGLKVFTEQLVSRGQGARPDKLVLYFGVGQAEAALSLVRQLHYEYGEEFESAIPETTVAVKDERGLEMAGVAFAQDPENRYRSYGEVHCGILSETYRYSRMLRGVDATEDFRERCLQNDVDPDDFAFNVGGRQAFAVIAEALG